MAKGSDEDGNHDNRGASVLFNGISVLRSFSVEEPELGVSDVAQRVGLHKSTVSRILSMLQEQDLVERDSATRRYRLGLGVISLAGPLLADLDARRVAYPMLRELSERTGETSALMIWNGTESVCVEQVPSSRLVKHTTPLGTRYNDALSASVQVFLASEEPARVRALLESGVIAYPGTRDGGVDAYLATIQRVAASGFAVNYGETSIEEVGVCAPIYDHRRTVVAAVLISAPRFRVSREQLTLLSEACVDAGQQITSRLGGTVS